MSYEPVEEFPVTRSVWRPLIEEALEEVPATPTVADLGQSLPPRVFCRLQGIVRPPFARVHRFEEHERLRSLGIRGREEDRQGRRALSREERRSVDACVVHDGA